MVILYRNNKIEIKHFNEQKKIYFLFLLRYKQIFKSLQTH